MAKKIDDKYDDLAKLAGIHFPTANQQGEKKETEKAEEETEEIQPVTKVKEEKIKDHSVEKKKEIKAKPEEKEDVTLIDNEDQSFFELIENLDFENKKSKLTFNKKQIYISDEVKELLEWMATITDKSLKSVTDIVVLEFYKLHRAKINEEYKRYLKNQKPGLA